MPIYSLYDLRKQAPKELQGLPDSDLVYEYAKNTGADPVQVAQAFGLTQNQSKRGALSAGLSSGTDDFQGLMYSAGAAVADAAGAKGLRDKLQRGVDVNKYESALNSRPDLDRIEDVYDSPSKWLPYAGYQVAKQIPNIAGTVAASALVPEAAIPATLARVGAVVPKALAGGGLRAGASIAERRAALQAGQGLAEDVVGGAAMNYAQGVGSLYQEAQEGGDPDAGVKSLIGGVPYGLAETVPEAMLLGRVKRGSGFQGSTAARMAKSGLTQAGTGATSELLQNEMEMAYNGNVSSDEAFSRRLNSGVAGGIVEGLLGSAGGLRRPKPALSQNGTTDLLNPAPAQEQPLLQSYGQAEGPLAPQAQAPQSVSSDKQAVNPDQAELFSPNGQPTYGADTSFGYDGGVDYVPAAAPEQQLGLAENHDLLQGNEIEYQPSIDTRGLSLAPAETQTQQQFPFGAQPQAQEAARPDFELTPQDNSQMELGLEPNISPENTLASEPTYLRRNQRGYQSNLPFTDFSNNPRAQDILMRAESLVDEGFLSEQEIPGLSQLVSKFQYGKAAKVIEKAMKEKAAHQSMLNTAQKIADKEQAEQVKAEQKAAQEVVKAQQAVNTTPGTASARMGTAYELGAGPSFGFKDASRAAGMAAAPVTQKAPMTGSVNEGPGATQATPSAPNPTPQKRKAPEKSAKRETAKVVALPSPKYRPATAVTSLTPFRYGDGTKGALVQLNNGKSVLMTKLDEWGVNGDKDLTELGKDLDGAAQLVLERELSSPLPEGNKETVDALIQSVKPAKKEDFQSRRNEQLEEELDAEDEAPAPAPQKTKATKAAKTKSSKPDYLNQIAAMKAEADNLMATSTPDQQERLNQVQADLDMLQEEVNSADRVGGNTEADVNDQIATSAAALLDIRRGEKSQPKSSAKKGKKKSLSLSSEEYENPVPKSVAENNYAALEGVTYDQTYKIVDEEGNIRDATLEVDAAEHLRQLDEKESRLQKILDCIKKGGKS